MVVHGLKVWAFPPTLKNSQGLNFPWNFIKLFLIDRKISSLNFCIRRLKNFKTLATIFHFYPKKVQNLTVFSIFFAQNESFRKFEIEICSFLIGIVIYGQFPFRNDLLATSEKSGAPTTGAQS